MDTTRARTPSASSSCRASSATATSDPVATRTAPDARGGEARIDLVGYVEAEVGIPAQSALGRPDLLLAERGAVGRGRALLAGSRITDHRAHRDERGPPILVAGLVQRRL